MGRQKDWPEARASEIRRMGRIFFARLCVCAALVAAASADRVFADPAALEPAPLDAAESERALAEIQARGVALYRRYSGIQSMRRLVAEERDPESGALLHTSRVLMERTDHFYGRPDVRVLEYELDGRTMDPDAFRLVRIAPPLPPFDEHGPENYDTRIAGLQRVDGRICYRVDVTPKKSTLSHMRGSFYFERTSLDLVYVEGGLATLPPGVREAGFAFHFAAQNGAPMPRSGVMHLRVRIPLVQPDRRFISRIENYNFHLMPR